jgi:hypothetical protein
MDQHPKPLTLEEFLAAKGTIGADPDLNIWRTEPHPSREEMMCREIEKMRANEKTQRKILHRLKVREERRLRMRGRVEGWKREREQG